MITAYLGLGANLGDRVAALRGARAALATPTDLRVVAASALYETEPVGGPPGQSDYLNAVVQVATRLSARELLQRCRGVEDLFGRERRQRWGARTLDIDILLFGEDVVNEEELIIPHPRLHLRSFVLAPLLDLAPDLRHPIIGETIRQLHARCPDDHRVTCLAERW